jgi:hypothetical protein
VKKHIVHRRGEERPGARLHRIGIGTFHTRNTGTVMIALLLSVRMLSSGEALIGL